MSLQDLQGKKKDKLHNQLTQLDRQLLIYEIFYFCKEICYKEITDRIPELGVRMIQRDVTDLKAADLINVRYDRDLKAYVHLKKRKDVKEKQVEYSEKKKKHLEQLARIGKLMFEMESDNVVDDFWGAEKEEFIFDRSKYRSCKDCYFEMFPDATLRMMQHDFEELRRIGYPVIYVRELDLYEQFDLDDVFHGVRNDFGVRLVDGQLVMIEGYEHYTNNLANEWDAFKRFS
jgi:hypothetical protein